MIAVLVLAVLSAILLAMWFRYSCALILRTKPNQTYANYVAELNGLTFLDVQSQLESATITDLSGCRDRLVDEYGFIIYLLHHAAEYGNQEQGFELRMLMLNFLLLRFWFPMSAPFSAEAGQETLHEMANIIVFIASGMGERVALSSQP